MGSSYGKININKKINVLDHGFVRLIDYMGSDLSIVRNARVSYNASERAGEDPGSDKRLINYLYRNGHNTPFESVTFTFEVKAPIFVLRQWMRHRTWCLSGDTRLRFVRPCDGKPYWKTLKEVADSWFTSVKEVQRPDKQKRNLRDLKRDQIKSMQLNCVEDGEKLTTTNITNVIKSGEKEVFRLTSKCGESIKATAEHRFLTSEGWKELRNINVGDKITSVVIAGKQIKAEIPKFTEEELANEVWSKSIYQDIEVSTLGRVKRKGEEVVPTENNRRFVVSVKMDFEKMDFEKIDFEKMDFEKMDFDFPFGEPASKLSNLYEEPVVWKTVQVSKIVADTFMEGEGHVLHINDNPGDNRLCNLRYGTDADNQKDSVTNGSRAIRTTGFRVVKSIESCGVEETYDISVAHKDHNFIAENFCVHNCYNEISARYKELPKEYYLPAVVDITRQSTDNKQMRTDERLPPDTARWVRQIIVNNNEDCYRHYQQLLSMDCPRELARSVLPVGMYSHMFATVNLSNLFKFLNERLHEHAQYEIRVYAQAIANLIKPIVPVAVAAWEKTS